MNKELTPAEKKAMDSLLKEAVGHARPPDLSQQILSRLHEEASDPNPSPPVVCINDRPPASHSGVTARQLGMALGLITALAASLMIAIALRPDVPSPATPTAAESADSARASLAEKSSTDPSASGSLASNSPDPGSSDPGSSDPGSSDPGSSDPGSSDPGSSDPGSRNSQSVASSPSKPPLRGIPLEIVASDLETTDTTAPRSAVDSLSQTPVQSIELVSTEVESNLRRYWDAIGIRPTSDASNQQVADRLNRLLGTKLPAGAFENPKRLQTQLGRKPVANAVARRWLRSITEQGLSRVDQKRRTQLSSDLAACFLGDQQLDKLFVSWINGNSPQSPAFYQAMSAGPAYAGGESAMLRRLASLTMNVDLRCIRCHDAYIDGHGQQSDYWGFAAFVRQKVAVGSDSKVTLRDATSSAKPVFYELPDGRQQVAEPSIGQGWMDDSSTEKYATVQQWSQRLASSEELASGVVNSLWQFVHGQPLRGRFVDPISAPHDKALDQLESDLVQDLVRSEFNIARTLALIICSPASRRGIPDALLPENALVAGAQELNEAKAAVNAFAASMPTRTALPLSQRIDQAMRASGGKLSSDGTSIVAQVGDTTKAPKPKLGKAPLAADFPGRADSLPVQWLARIKNDASQVQHLGYLAGMTSLPKNVRAVAKQMAEADGKSTALHRVWWLVRP